MFESLKQNDLAMRQNEWKLDRRYDPKSWIIVRLDGRNFHTLTNKNLDLEKPFDPTFKQAMVDAATSLLECGFEISFAYSQSDEISALIPPIKAGVRPWERKVLSLLSSQVSVAFSQSMKTIGIFDARLSIFDSPEQVKNYFVWRRADARRNALNAYAYWTLRKEMSAKQADQLLRKTKRDQKLAILKEKGIDFLNAPFWQKHGWSVYKQDLKLQGINRQSGKTVSYIRKKNVVNEGPDLDLGLSQFLK